MSCLSRNGYHAEAVGKESIRLPLRLQKAKKISITINVTVSNSAGLFYAIQSNRLRQRCKFHHGPAPIEPSEKTNTQIQIILIARLRIAVDNINYGLWLYKQGNNYVWCPRNFRLSILLLPDTESQYQFVTLKDPLLRHGYVSVILAYKYL